MPLAFHPLHEETEINSGHSCQIGLDLGNCVPEQLFHHLLRQAPHPHHRRPASSRRTTLGRPTRCYRCHGCPPSSRTPSPPPRPVAALNLPPPDWPGRTIRQRGPEVTPACIDQPSLLPTTD